MERITTSQNDRLLDYLDGKLSGAEAAMLKNQLEQSQALRQRLEALRLVHTFLSKRSENALVPQHSFTDQVMRNLDRLPSTSNAISPRNGLILLCGILVATGIGLLVLVTGVFDGISTTITLDSTQVPKQFTLPAIESIPFSGKMLMKILIIINIGLALVVLDRTVLKPYFGRKHQSQSFS